MRSWDLIVKSLVIRMEGVERLSEIHLLVLVVLDARV
jgi:hypothetical protein